AEAHGVRPAEDSEQRTSAPTVVASAHEETGDLDELHGHAVDAGDRGNRPRRRERVVPGLDLDARERLEQRRLAGIRRADEGDLRGSLTAHGDRVAVHGLLADARLLDLARHPLADVSVGAALVAGQLREDRAQLLDPLAA